MGFYVRKRVSAGPFRFNLSKSGLGVSVGVPGFRVGRSPRGNYVHTGRHGVYYRSSLGGRRAQAPVPASTPATSSPAINGVLLENITGASAAQLVPTGPGDLVSQLNAAAKRIAVAPWLLLVVLIVLAVNPLIGAFLLIPGIPAVVWLWLRDRAARTVVAFFDVNDEVAAWFEGLVNSFELLCGVKGIWRITASGDVQGTYEWKVNAGASTLLSRARTAIGTKGPKVLATNIVVPTITCGRHALHFLPDRLLVREGRRFSDVAYSSLTASATPTSFIEDGRVPGDAERIGTTWRFVNKSGGPDRRFNNNRQLPVMRYGRLDLLSRAGLHWTLDVSRVDTSIAVATSISAAPRSLGSTLDPVSGTTAS